jgi:hypothetical protein
MMEGLLIGAIVGMVVMGLVIRSVVGAMKPPVIHNAPVANASANSSGATGAGVPGGVKVPVQPLLFVAALAVAALLLGSVARGGNQVPVTQAVPQAAPQSAPVEVPQSYPVTPQVVYPRAVAPEGVPWWLYVVVAVLVVVAAGVWGTIGVMMFRRKEVKAKTETPNGNLVEVVPGHFRPSYLDKSDCVSKREIPAQRVTNTLPNISVTATQGNEREAVWEKAIPDTIKQL